MTVPWLIIADDLTGAADCGVAFARRGVESTLGWGDAVSSGGVLAYNVDSRAMSPEAAAASHRHAIQRHLAAGVRVLKKIDSALRGHPGAEIAATASTIRAHRGSAFGILAPAFPAAGRTVENGIVHLDGARLDRMTGWQRNRHVRSADLRQMLCDAGMDNGLVPLRVVRSDPSMLRSTLLSMAEEHSIAVCDAVVQDDLDRIVAAAFPASDSTFFAGTAGLASALAATLAHRERDPHPGAAARGGSLVVVGSFAAISQRAAAACSASGMHHESIDARDLAGEEPAAGVIEAIGRIVDVLRRGDDAMIQMTGELLDGAVGPRLAHRLATALQSTRPHIGGLVATGGETAAALFAALGIASVRLIDELEPGVCLGVSSGRLSIPVVTRSGAFGDEETLLRAVQRLRHLGS